MTKNAVRVCVVLAVVLAVFSAIAFVVPFAKTTVFWIAYGFGAIAILFQLYVFKISLSGDARSRFYGFPIARIGIYYLAAQLAVSIIEMILAKFAPVWVALLVNILLVGTAIIGCITTDAMRDEINVQDQRLKKSVTAMRELQSLSRALVGQCPDGELKAMVEKLADEFRYSDPVSSEATSALEADMRSQMGDIQQALVDGDVDAGKKLCGKLAGSLAERNRICSVSK